MQTRQLSAQDTEKGGLNKRLEDIAWALFLIMIGILWLMPSAQVPEGAWLIGTGVILLGLNGVRYLNGIRMRTLGIILGVLALAGGLGSRYGIDLPLFAILLIIVGASILMKPWIQQKGNLI